MKTRKAIRLLLIGLFALLTPLMVLAAVSPPKTVSADLVTCEASGGSFLPGGQPGPRGTTTEDTCICSGSDDLTQAPDGQTCVEDDSIGERINNGPESILTREELCANDPDLPQCVDGEDTCQSIEDGNCAFLNRVNDFMNIMGIITIPIISLMVVIGGIEYSMSNGNPQKAQAGKDRIYKGAWALGAFLFMWTFLQWLIPGGIIA